MKKFLSLVLALVMTMSLVTVAGAKDFTDADKTTYVEAVDVISALEIVGGYADGSFNPEGQLTRGAAAKIICNILVGPETAATLVANTAPYSDVPANHTFAGYIAFCANEGIISGYADGTFKPAAPLTGYAFMKMLLGVVGYNTDAYTGTNWAINVAQDVVKAKLDKNIVGKFNGNKVVTREEACLFALNALNAAKMTYSEGSKVTVGGIEVTTGAGNVVPYGGIVRDYLFSDLKLTEGKKDALGRPAHEWELKVDKKWESIGVYADAADYIFENGFDKDGFEDALEEWDVEVAADAGLTYATTTHGRTIEIFDIDEDDVIEKNEWIYYEAIATKAEITKDKVSTKDADERAVSFKAGGMIVFDNEVKGYKGKVEVDNFDAIYDAADADDDQLFLVTYDAKGNVYSIEIPETFEAKVTRVNVKDMTFVAGGETYAYTTQSGVPAIGTYDITICECGIAYAFENVAEEISDVIYVDAIFAEEDKWGEWTVTANIVTEEYEVAEVTLYADLNGDDVVTEDEVDAVLLLAGDFYIYELEDGEYDILQADYDAATQKETKFYDFVNTVAIDDEDKYVVAGGKKVYFADDMTVVYISDAGTKDLAVTVKTGAQNIKVGETAAYILNSDKDIAVLYVGADYYSGVSEDVMFISDTTKTPVSNLKDKEAAAITVYVDGVEEEIIVAKDAKVEAGFFTYEIDAKTGEYTLTAVKEYKDYIGKVVGTDLTIYKDTYVDCGSVKDAPVVEIVDLTDEGLDTLAELVDWTEDKNTITVSFIYDADEKEITILYVEKVVANEAV